MVPKVNFEAFAVGAICDSGQCRSSASPASELLRLKRATQESARDVEERLQVVEDRSGKDFPCNDTFVILDAELPPWVGSIFDLGDAVRSCDKSVALEDVDLKKVLLSCEVNRRGSLVPRRQFLESGGRDGGLRRVSGPDVT